MTAVREILDLSIEPLTKDAAAAFGKALVFNGGVRPTSGGDWWRCWEGCAELSAGRQWAGFVRAQPSVPDIQEMEREPGTEMILPVNGEIVQVVALGTRDAAGVERPDGRSARAFFLKPGSALVMSPGVWHAAAFGLGREASYFYIAERRKAEESEGRCGWVEIAERIILRPRRARVAPGQVEEQVR